MPFALRPYEVCSFCQDLSGERECAFIVQNDGAAAELDERQYERGAMLVIPSSHRASILDIEPDELSAVYRLVKQVATAATAAFGATGMSIFQNNGLSAGQSEPHFHVHVVPRYATSDPERRFLQRDYEVLPMDRQRAIAEEIRRALP